MAGEQMDGMPPRKSGKTKPGALSKKTSGTRRVPSLLVLVHDVGQLCADGLDLSQFAWFVAGIGAFASGADVEVRQITSVQSLHSVLASFEAAGRTFDVLVSIGHSNEQGIKAASDWFATWEEYAGTVKPLSPRRLMLIACRAGRWPAARILFRKLAKLRRIFASPVNVSFDVAKLMLATAPYLLEVKAPSAGAVAAAQAFFLTTTGGQLRQWQRDRDMNDPDGVLLDIGAALLDPMLQGVPDLLWSILRRP